MHQKKRKSSVVQMFHVCGIRTLLLALLFIGGLSTMTDLSAQTTSSISGTVVSTTGEPIIGATILIEENPTIGAITDLDGKFELPLPAGSKNVSVSYLGYTTQTINIEGRSILNVKLEEDATTLEEVQVIAYGTQSKVSVTSALSNIGTEDLLKVTTASVTNSLAGSMTGVSSVQAIGQPGMEQANLYIRGSSTLSDDGSDAPLILVDGVERSFSDIDPNEISNITVMKDASSTAVFGVKGANGVILVTTRRGTEGKPQISVSSSVTIQTPTRLVENCDSYTTAMLYNEQLANDNNTSNRFSDYALEMFRTGADPIMYPDTDWREMIFKDAYAQTQHNVNISGGSDRVRYFTSMSYLYQDGLIKDFDQLDYDNGFAYNRFNYRANLDIEVTKSTQLKVNIGGVVGSTHEPKGNNDGLWRQVNWATPYASPGLNEDGVEIMLPATEGNYFPVWPKTGLSAFYGMGYQDKTKNTLNFDITAEQDLSSLVEGLKFHVKGSYNTTYNFNVTRSGGLEKLYAHYEGVKVDGQSIPTTMEEAEGFNNNIIYIPAATNNPLSYNETMGRTRNWYLEGAFNYNRTFGTDHRVAALLLYNQTRTYYPTAANGNAMDYQYIPRSYLGVVGRVSYSFRNKYLLDANVGYNGSENFAPGTTRYGVFPSGSVGWVLSEENFIKDIDFISFFKLRASYGIVGNDKMGTDRFMYMPSTWNPNGGGYNFGVDVSSSDKGATEGQMGNPVITWETAAKQNYGVDIKLFDSRLSASVDYFYEHRSSILITLQTTPTIIAAQLPKVNRGELENKGYEVELRWNDKFEGGNYYIGATTSYAKNKILEMDESTPVNSFNAQTGLSTGLTYGYVFDRFYTEEDFGSDGKLLSTLPECTIGTPYPGDNKYVDLDKDGDIDADDCTYLGYSTKRPEYTFGLNYGVNWKGWTMSMQWLGVTNVSRNLDTEYRIPFSPSQDRALLEWHAEQRWTPATAETATMPRLSKTSKSLNYGVNSSLWLRDASYIRLKNVQLGYTFKDAPFFRKIGVNNIFVYLSGYNLLTFDHIKYLDPEAPTGGGRDNQYPVNKTYTFGVKLNF